MQCKKQSVQKMFYYCLRSAPNHRVVLGAAHGPHTGKLAWTEQ